MSSNTGLELTNGPFPTTKDIESSGSYPRAATRHSLGSSPKKTLVRRVFSKDFQSITSVGALQALVFTSFS